MPFHDFRQFLDVMRQQGELVDINQPIALTDVGKALKHAYAKGRKATSFNKNGTEFPLVCGVYSSRKHALIAFETDEKNVTQKVLDGLNKPIAPKISNGGGAPCQEVVITDDIDIRRFPIPTYSPKDGGPYITPGIVVSKDPETGVPDIGHYRFLILGKDTFSFSAQPFHRFGKNLTKCQQMGVTPKAALIIGVDPILAYTCQVQVHDQTNDWEVAGGLRGAPVELTHCKTCDIEVPSTSEVVIEFEVDMNNTVMEGPLGEYTGYYTPASLKPVAKITAITHRKKPIFQGLLTGKPVTENHILKQIPFEASFLRALKAQFPTIVDVSVRASAGVSFFVVISMTAALQGRAAAGDPQRHVEQHPAEMDGDRRARHRRAQFRRGGVGDGVPHPAAGGRDHRRRHPGRSVRSLDRRSQGGAADARRFGDRRRRHAAVRQAVLGSGGRAGLGGLRDSGARCVAVRRAT